MKILITGSTGRIGRAIVHGIGTEHELIHINRSKATVPTLSKYYVQDFTEFETMAQIIETERPDAIIHLAALLGPDSDQNPELARKVNVGATKTLALAATKNGVSKFVFASTSAVYNQKKLEPTDEQSNIEPVGVYGETKLEAEQAIARVSASNTEFISLRLFNIYGPSFNDSLVSKLVNSKPSDPVILYGPNNYYRDYVRIDDVVNAFKLCLGKHLEGKNIINIGSGVVRSNEELIDELKKLGCNISYKIEQSDTTISWADIGKAQKLLGFNPDTQLRIS